MQQKKSVVRQPDEGRSLFMHLIQQPQITVSCRCATGVGDTPLANVSIVVPAHCEEGNLGELYEQVVGTLPDITWELIIVDDGSTDNTWNEIYRLHKQDCRVKGLRLSRNFGHQYALFAGLANSVGEAVITMDADLQHPPAVIPQLLTHWGGGSKIVHTVRIDSEAIPWTKKTTSRLFY